MTREYVKIRFFFSFAVMALTGLFAPASFAAPPGGNGNARYFTGSIGPDTVTADSGPTNLSLTFVNCTSTDCSGYASSPSQKIGSIDVSIPAGFSDVVLGDVMATGTDNQGNVHTWHATLDTLNNKIRLRPDPGNNKLAPGDSVTVELMVTADCGDTIETVWLAVASNTVYTDDQDVEGQYELVAYTLGVTIDGTCGGFNIGDYETRSQGAWGSPKSSTSAMLSQNFVTAYGIFTVGINGEPIGGLSVGDFGQWRMTFSGPTAVKDYLPAGGTPARLSQNHVNPTSTESGNFGGQVLALKLNVDFNDWGYLDGTEGTFSVLKLKDTGTFLDGATISQILSEAEMTLGGGSVPSGYTMGSFNDLITKLNEAFDNSVPSTWAVEHLTR